MNSIWSKALSLPLFCYLAVLSPLANSQGTVDLPPGTSQQVMQSFNEGGQLLMSGHSAQAAEKLEAVTAALPNVAEAHSMYGTALLKCGKVQEALEELEKANKIKPNLQVVLMNLGVAYQTVGRSQDALKMFQKYLVLYPTGQFAKNITAMVNMLKTEVSRTQGIESSKGKDNYFPEALALGATRWNTASMPIVVHIADGKGVAGYHEEFATILQQVFEEWIAATEGKLKVEFTNNPSVASIDCQWTDKPGDLVNPSEGGQALVFPDVNGSIKQVKVKLLTRAPSAFTPLTPKVLKHICLHEIGHSLGLLGHSSDPGDIMFSSVNFEVPRESLSERDKKTMATLYSAPDSLLAEKRVSLNKGAFSGDGGPVNEAIKLIARGVEQSNAKKYQDAIVSFEKARHLAPDLEAPVNNLASVYASLGDEEARNKDLVHSQEHYLKAAELFKKLGMKEYEQKVYKALASVARLRGNQAESTKYENTAKALSGSN